MLYLTIYPTKLLTHPLVTKLFSQSCNLLMYQSTNNLPNHVTSQQKLQNNITYTYIHKSIDRFPDPVTYTHQSTKNLPNHVIYLPTNQQDIY